MTSLDNRVILALDAHTLISRPNTHFPYALSVITSRAMAHKRLSDALDVRPTKRFKPDARAARLLVVFMIGNAERDRVELVELKEFAELALRELED
jgi:hypothetical protein